MPDQGAFLKIRGHTLLCLQGFQGLGYDQAFTENMARLHVRLLRAPQTLVMPVSEPDEFCAACPHLKGGCTLKGPDHEAHMRQQDLEVLRRLDLTPGKAVSWAEILDKIRAAVQGADLDTICRGCPWLPLGVCAIGIERLKASS